MNYEFEIISQANAIEYAKINIKSWVESYTDIVDVDYLESINTINEIEKMKTALINNLKDGSLRYLLKVNNGYVGIFRVRKTKYEGFEDYGELGALYLLNKVKKNGYGRIVFDRAKRELSQMGYGKMIVGCLEENPSNDFYVHMGGVFVKKNPIRIGTQDLNENIYIFKGIRENYNSR